MIVVEKMAKSM